MEEEVKRTDTLCVCTGVRMLALLFFRWDLVLWYGKGEVAL